MNEQLKKEVMNQFILNMNKFKYKKPEFNYVKNDLIKLLRKIQKSKSLKQNVETDYFMLINIKMKLDDLIKSAEIKLELQNQTNYFNIEE